MIKKFFFLKILINLIILLFLTISISISAAFSENNKLGINNFCNELTIENLLIDKLKVKFIEINIDQQRKWHTNALRAVTEGDPAASRSNIIEKKRKKKFKSTTTVHYSNNKKCIFKSKVRIHGDLLDHIKFDDGFPLTSMHVDLLNGNIDNVVTFKLFLPETRNFMNEIFIANFFKHLNFISPKTSILKVKINDRYYNYIFQEHIRKELLETNSLVEGPILEGHEDFENSFGGAKRLGRVTNYKWANKGQDELNTTVKALSKFNKSVLISHMYKSVNNEIADEEELITDKEIFFGENSKLTEQFLAYNAFMYALDATHGLNLSDRRFYYDHIYSSFMPIYYDGDSRLFIPHASNKSETYKFLRKSSYTINNKYYRNFNKVFKSTKIGARKAINLMKNLDILEFKKNLNENGFQIKLNDLNLALNLIEKRLTEIENINEYQYKKVGTKEPYYSYFVYDKEINLIFANVNEASLYKCPVSAKIKNNCEKLVYENQLIPPFLSQKIRNGKDYDNVFISNDVDDYFLDTIKKKNNFDIKRFVINDVTIKNYGNSLIEIDKDKKSIKIQDLDSQSRTVFFGGSLEKWKIEYNNLSLGKNFIKKINGLTGCLTFADIIIEDIDLNLKNSSCEDSVNFIRSSGSINNIEIMNSYSDAFDADFSNLFIKKVTVKNAKNDCLDFSYGKYKIENANLDNCEDKGISFGENSNGFINNITISNSNIGIASKDSSIVKIKKISNQISKICLAAYRKKQEFYGSIILFNEMNCSRTEKDVYVELGSKIKSVNLNEL